MELRSYLRLLRKRCWLVLLVLGLAVGAGVLVTVRTTPRYSSTVTFFVTAANRGDIADAYQGELYSQQRVKSYADLLTSERLARALVDRNGLAMSPRAVSSEISPSIVPDTVLLRASVTDTSRSRSLRIASALADQFTLLIRQLETPPDGTAPTVKAEVVDGPRLDPAPVSPRPVRDIGIAAVLGLLLGMGLALVFEMLDTTVKSVEVLRDTSGAPVLITVAHDSAAKAAPLAVDGNDHSPRAEAFRQLRTNLRFVDAGRPLQVLAVVSAAPSEGKSTTAANLAATMAQAGVKVLLVEADLRRPTVAEYLGVEGAVGLTNLLVGQVDVDDVLQPVGPPGLWILPSGSIPPNPSELLGSRRMGDLLNLLRQRFDTIILDSSALLPVTDGAVAAAWADGSLLVVRHGRTTRSQVASATAMLQAVEAKVIGCLFNMVRRTRDVGPYAYQYGYPPRPGRRPRLEDMVAHSVYKGQPVERRPARRGALSTTGATRRSAAPRLRR